MTFKYDPFGRRICKTSSTGTTIYAYDGDNMVEQLSSSGTATARYTQGLGIDALRPRVRDFGRRDEPLEVYEGGKSYYYHADGLGSVVALTKSTGTAANTYFGYNTFGGMPNPSETVANPFRFTSREWDSETGLYYYRARYYDSLFGRFLSEDPIGFNGADLNLYRQVRNNVPNFTDPIGLFTIDPSFPSSCLPSLNRALHIVRRIAAKDKNCNCIFQHRGSNRSLKELIDDPHITIHYSEEGKGEEANQVAFTIQGDPSNIFIRPLGCRIGRWEIAAKLVHELAHTTQKPAATQQQMQENEDDAKQVEIECGFPLATLRTVITVTPEN